MSPKLGSITAKISLTPCGVRRRNYSSNLAKTKILKQTPEITRPGSVTPLETITFLEENETESLTDDWAKSLLYQKIAMDLDVNLQMTEQEMLVISRKPPRDKQVIAQVMEKGLDMLKGLLMELLGTKEDMERFQERFKGRSCGHVRALMERCLSLMKVRNETVDILIDVNKRENIMKNLENSRNRVKDKVLKVYRLNKVIRDKVGKWAESECIPFSKFIFKGNDYLVRICEDNILLQEYLNRPSLLKQKLK